jgi:hypothetical protein
LEKFFGLWRQNAQWIRVSKTHDILY